mmetsp:Transcript_214/g.343  ORF Transcript_214/g.343 Transcript_214/m.343 type:complete len:322 (+) Transcript_214:219-1184(+)|eukprot:CAMPEP_0184020138 /NCGR_PEP_ID=MMETSP0954-20121128/9176_1 /TAXON_ID=627963 /ORGANISM="Aplanochytrium sp, Strain PBS07" /LENGTH=321 /DNA_ID=CAMNT_0026301953 /DNA_START=156 /DNA_END=1121 /DNA_ORIENTATION=+
MKLFNKFSGLHEDFIHDVEYDFYGKRLATCSSDHKIKMWSAGPSGEWQCEAELEGHKGAVWKVAWAHPEFGQILASCSFDQNVCIWEEQDAPLTVSSQSSVDSKNEETSRQGRWQQVAKLNDNQGSVTDIKFAPRHQGLSFAMCSADGYIRIYVAEDIMNLNNWTLSEKFQVGSKVNETTCLSWNPSRFDKPMLVVGGHGEIAKVWMRDDEKRQWRVQAELIKHKGNINDVCWSPCLGRSYHLIATASSDTQIKIWRLSKSETGEVKVECEAELSQETEVWRCAWNITGTILATSGDDGAVRLWKKNFQGKYICISNLEKE